MARLNPGGFSVTYANASDWCAYEWPVRWMLQRSLPMEKTIHAVARYRSLAARACAQDAAQWLADAPVYPWPALPASEPPVAVLAFGTTRADNLWPTQDWATLGRHLLAQGFRLALPQSSEQELQWAQQLAGVLGPACQVWPRMSLAELKTHMASAALVVGVDSGLSHLAIALNLPVVQIFSQPRVARAGPVGRAHQQAVGGERAPQPDEVWPACQQVLAAAPVRLSA
jgi:heptosyltransferase-1